MFRLLRLTIRSHPILGDINLDLCDQEKYSRQLFQTVIIGPNGTGKSYILQTIVNIFRECAYYLKTGERNNAVPGAFYLHFIKDMNSVEIASPGYVKEYLAHYNIAAEKMPALYFTNQGKLTEDASLLPNKILASSMIFTDKFPAIEDEYLPGYRYLGVRNIKSPSSAGTRIINRKVTEALTSSLSKPHMFNLIQEFLNELGYSPSIKISHKPKYRPIFFNKDLSVAEFKRSFENWETTFKDRSSAPWGMGYYIRIREDEATLKRIVAVLNNAELQPKGKGGKAFEYELSENTKSGLDYEAIRHLQSLDLLTYPTVNIVKSENEFDFTGSSSGEQNIIFTMLMLLANIEHQSLVLIDEPELSLHPNWQMQFFHLLRKVFRKFADVQVIAATHSHFMISDLDGAHAKIVALKREKDDIFQMPYPKNLNTFGWSSEDVLYNIFNVRSSLNYYLEADLTELLGMMSNNIKDEAKIRAILKKLEDLPRRDNDPLQEIIIEAKDYLSDITS